MKYTYVLIAILSLSSCSSDDAGNGPEVPPQGASCDTQAPAPESLQWKRTRAFTHDLMSALELQESQVCSELGDIPCDELHRFALGSSDPFGATVYERPGQPSVVTPLAMERVVLAACSNRVALDVAGPDRVVFTSIDLAAASLDSEADAVGEQIRALYRRLLRRDATEEEVAIVAELAAPEVSAATFSQLACFSIATTTEFLFC